MVDNKPSTETMLCRETGLYGLFESSLSQSIMESVDRKGGSIAVGVEFCATVQRIFKTCRKNVASDITSSSRLAFHS
jgi:hypothetical protein